MVVRRIGAFSCAKMLGALYALLGLLFGVFYALLSLLFAVIGFSTETGSGGGIAAGTFGLIFAVISIILFPIMFGIVGFIAGLINAFLYNLLARFVGGIELDLVDQRSTRGF